MCESPHFSENVYRRKTSINSLILFENSACVCYDEMQHLSVFTEKYQKRRIFFIKPLFQIRMWQAIIPLSNISIINFVKPGST